ncbi:MAG: hypothetical protein RIC89_17350 [Pseudomonadales bacterium]
MPCDYHINPNEGLVTITGSAEVSLAEAISTGRSLLVDQAYDPDLPHLIDLRDLRVDMSTQNPEVFRDFVLHEYRHRVTGLVAVVVNDSLQRRALAALYLLTSQVAQSELFDDYNLALRWLMRHEFAPKAKSDSLRKFLKS